ncbi:MAG: hypothetical protein AAGI90_06265 [Chlamydiota bacterium]
MIHGIQKCNRFFGYARNIREHKRLYELFKGPFYCAHLVNLISTMGLWFAYQAGSSFAKLNAAQINSNHISQDGLSANFSNNIDLMFGFGILFISANVSSHILSKAVVFQALIPNNNALFSRSICEHLKLCSLLPSYAENFSLARFSESDNHIFHRTRNFLTYMVVLENSKYVSISLMFFGFFAVGSSEYMAENKKLTFSKLQIPSEVSMTIAIMSSLFFMASKILTPVVRQRVVNGVVATRLYAPLSDL